VTGKGGRWKWDVEALGGSLRKGKYIKLERGEQRFHSKAVLASDEGMNVCGRGVLKGGGTDQQDQGGTHL